MRGLDGKNEEQTQQEQPVGSTAEVGEVGGERRRSTAGAGGRCRVDNRIWWSEQLAVAVYGSEAAREESGGGEGVGEEREAELILYFSVSHLNLPCKFF